MSKREESASASGEEGRRARGEASVVVVMFTHPASASACAGGGEWCNCAVDVDALLVASRRGASPHVARALAVPVPTFHRTLHVHVLTSKASAKLTFDAVRRGAARRGADLRSTLTRVIHLRVYTCAYCILHNS